MKMIKKLLLSALAFTALSVNAQTVDEIIAKNTEAMGGAAKISALNTVKMSGSMSAQGMDIPLTITKFHMKGFRLDIEVMGTSNYQIITPDKAYMFFPIQQMTEPKELDAETVKTMQSQLDLQGVLFNYKEKGTTLELSGTEKIEGSDAYKLKALYKSGKTTTFFIDKSTNRVVRTISKAKTPDGTETDLETSYNDYKQNADGYWFSYSTTTPQGPIVFDKIEANLKVDENIFKN